MLHEDKVRHIANELRAHFIEKLGWDNRNVDFTAVVDNEEIDEKVFCIAHKRGYCIYLCRKAKIKNRTKFQEGLKRLTHENIVVFVGKDKWTWQIITVNKNRSKSVKRIHVPSGYIPEIKFHFEEEGSISLLNVCHRVENVFNKHPDFKKPFEAVEILT